MDEDKQDRKVRVIDRRWFNAEGEPRGTDPGLASGVPPKATDQPAPPERPSAPRDDKGTTLEGSSEHRGEAGFVDLVDFFAQQALAFLSGEVPGRPRDPDTARYLIDLLGVVQEKSVGQLTTEEHRYLEDVLFQLRSLFVASVR